MEISGRQRLPEPLHHIRPMSIVKIVMPYAKIGELDIYYELHGPADGEPLVRHRADLVVPEATEVEIGVLKGIAAHYVMQADDRVSLMERQRVLVAELVEAIWDRGPDALDPVFVQDWDDAADDAGRRRVVIDQVASLTDASAVARHAALTV